MIDEKIYVPIIIEAQILFYITILVYPQFFDFAKIINLDYFKTVLSVI